MGSGCSASSDLHPLLRRANRRILPGRLLFGPDWIVLGVNNACNLHCRMCDVGTGTDESNFGFHLTGTRPMNMPLALADRVVEQTARHFPRARIGYAFTEPLAWPHLVASVANATRAGLRTAVTTNALKLPTLAEALADAGLGELYVSLDGPDEVHDHIRRHPGSFARAMEGMRRITPHVRVSVFCTITEWNTGSLVRLLDALRPLPLARVGFMHPNFVTAGMAAAQTRAWTSYGATPSNLVEFALDRVDRDQLWREMSAVRAGGWPFPVDFSPRIASRDALDDFYLRPERAFARACGDVSRALMVKSDGSVIPAHGRCYRVEVGNLHSTELDRLWNAPALARLRKDLRKAGGLFPACTRCCSAMG